VERVTNGIARCSNLSAAPAMESRMSIAREAVMRGSEFPNDGLSAMTPRQRQQLANRVTVTMRAGEGRVTAASK